MSSADPTRSQRERERENVACSGMIDDNLLVNVDCSGIRLVHRLRLRLLVVGWNLLVVRRIDGLAGLCSRAILLRPGVVLAVETSI